MFRATVMASTVTARTHGFLYQASSTASFFSVRPHTMPRSSESGLGWVTRETAIVTTTHTIQAQNARAIDAPRAVQRHEVHSKAGSRSSNESGEPTPARRAPPEHAQEERPEQRGQEQAMQHLDVVHDANEAESQVGRCDAQEHPNNCGD